MSRGNVASLFNSYAREVTVELEQLASERRGLLSASSGRHWHTYKPKSPTRREFQQVSTNASTPNASPDEYQAIWQHHELLWARFESSSDDSITVDSIPFPPCDADVLDFLFQSNRDLDAKAVYQLACRRWHPDKFIQIFGSRISSQDLEVVKQRLNSISQEINVKWDAEKLRFDRLASAHRK